MNHAKLTREALRFRLQSVNEPLFDPDAFDVDAAAAFAVSCGDTDIDSALRRLGTAWREAGLDPDRICEPWRPDDVRRLLRARGSVVIDALDDILRSINRQAVFS